MDQEIKLHANNTNFSWNIPEGPYGFFSKEDIKCFNEKGFVVVEDAFSPSEVANVIDQIDPYEFNVTEALKGLDGGKFFISRAEEITFTTHLVTQSEQLKSFSRHEVFSNICRDLIGPDVRLYWDQAVYKKPGTKDEFPWHQDNGYTFIEPQAYLTCWIALTDTDETNGCPWVMPGLHQKGTLFHEPTDLGHEIPLDSSESICLPLKAGSIAIFSSLTPHRTGPNLSDGIRKSYILQYAPDGAKRVISQSLTEDLKDESRQFLILKDGESVN
jgi:ectoine hydroxylase-related dioxygenase (phytanoyl-CoA dioxygenase family)